jgi:integrase
MASARQKGNKWYARWRLQDGRGAEKGGFLDRKSALNFAKEQEVLERKNINTRPSEVNMTVFDFVASVWKSTLTVRSQTKMDYQRSLNSHILPKFGDTPMARIKPADIESWMSELENNTGLSPRTIEKHVNLLASILKKAQENGYIQKTPFATLKRKKAKILRKRIPLENHEVKALAQELPQQYRILVWIGYWTGMRPSEILGLSWSQLDFEKGTITIDRQISGKTNEIWESAGLKTDASSRVIGFSKELQRLIKEHVESFGFGPEGLILKNRLGGVLRYKDAARLFRNAATAAGLQESQRMHVLRHTCVSLLIAQGVNIKAIQAWVGHSSISQTLDTYGHLFPGSMSELAEKLDEYALLAASEDFLRMAN